MACKDAYKSIQCFLQQNNFTPCVFSQDLIFMKIELLAFDFYLKNESDCSINGSFIVLEKGMYLRTSVFSQFSVLDIHFFVCRRIALKLDDTLWHNATFVKLFVHQVLTANVFPSLWRTYFPCERRMRGGSLRTHLYPSIQYNYLYLCLF